MKAFLIHSVTKIFGQTEAGQHLSFPPERVIASVDFADSTEAISRFMSEAQPVVCIRLSNGHEIEVPVAPTKDGLYAVYRIESLRGPNDPYVLPWKSGERRLHFGVDPQLQGGSVLMDGVNLAYQRSLLGR